MSTKIKDSNNGIIEQKILEYIQENPNFFEKYPDALDSVKIEHNVHGSVSLVERQILNLREREAKHKKQIAQMLETAGSNSNLLMKSTDLTVALINAHSEQELFDRLQLHFKKHFAFDDCKVWLFEPKGGLSGVKYSDLKMIQQLTDQLFISNEPVCGRVTDSIAQVFDGNKELESYAIIPIGESAQKAVIAIGSKDANLFTADLGTLFLRMIGDVVEACLAKYR